MCFAAPAGGHTGMFLSGTGGSNGLAFLQKPRQGNASPMDGNPDLDFGVVLAHHRSSLPCQR